MKFVEKAKELIKQHKIQAASTNILEDVIRAFTGDYISTAKIILAIGKFPFLFGNNYSGQK